MCKTKLLFSNDTKNTYKSLDAIFTTKNYSTLKFY